MFLSAISLQNFRSYKKADFSFENTTLIVGPNTAGKTNLIEAIFFLCIGKSFRAEKDTDVISYEQEMARINALIVDREELQLEIMITNGSVSGIKMPLKKFLVNGVGKTRADFSSHLSAILFSPVDVEILTQSPSYRRRFLDDVLEQADKGYSASLTLYVKALRQRNALLEKARETGTRSEKEFLYWDDLLIKNGNYITSQREAFLNFANLAEKNIFSFFARYDKSIISHERLLQYKDAEMGSAVTLVGPHRDDFQIFLKEVGEDPHDIRFYGSRGQQRMAILQLKILQLDYLEKIHDKRPLLLLDDIFSELDENHINHILGLIEKQQTIMTTTHKDFVPASLLPSLKIIELLKQ